MPFTNDIAGGQGSLVRNWLQSANFVTGVSGWQIRKDGNVEFNNGTFRGSITSGNPAGNHIIINNTVSGNAVEVYNAANQLVYAIQGIGINAGRAISYVPGTAGTTQDGAYTLNGGYTISKTGASTTLYTGSVSEVFTDGATKDSQMQLQSFDSNSGDSSFLILHSAYLGGLPTVEGNERNISGSVVQSDQFATNNLFHAGFYSGVISGAGGAWAIPHGCTFTPKAVSLTSYDVGGTGEAYSFGTWNTPVFTSTICNTFWRHSTTQAALAAGTAVAVYAAFYG